MRTLALVLLLASSAALAQRADGLRYGLPGGSSSSGSTISTNPLDAGAIFTPGVITGQGLFLLRPTATNEAARCYPASVGVDGNCIFDFYEQSDISNTAHVWMGMVGVDGWVTLGFEGAVIASTKAGSGTTKDLHITAADGSDADRLQAADLAMTIYAADQTVLARKKFEVNGATYLRTTQAGALDAGSIFTPGRVTGAFLRTTTTATKSVDFAATTASCVWSFCSLTGAAIGDAAMVAPGATDDAAFKTGQLSAYVPIADFVYFSYCGTGDPALQTYTCRIIK